MLLILAEGPATTPAPDRSDTRPLASSIASVRSEGSNTWPINCRRTCSTIGAGRPDAEIRTLADIRTSVLVPYALRPLPQRAWLALAGRQVNSLTAATSLFCICSPTTSLLETSPASAVAASTGALVISLMLTPPLQEFNARTKAPPRAGLKTKSTDITRNILFTFLPAAVKIT